MRGGAVKVIGSEAPVAGSGFYQGLAGDGTSYMYVAPKSTEVARAWGSNGTVRSTTSTTNGVANTTTLFGFGSAAHPAAYYAKSLTTGGYNTWYLPAKDETLSLYSNKTSIPVANRLLQSNYWTSTEFDGTFAFFRNLDDGNAYTAFYDKSEVSSVYIRAVRRSAV